MSKKISQSPASGLAAVAETAIGNMVEGDHLPPVHPGEILVEEFLTPHGLSAIRLAQRMHVPRTRVERLVGGLTSVTPDTALRLERAFGASAEFWINLQTRHDLELARRDAAPDIADIAAVERVEAPG